jgi:hypothetical protein
MLIAINAFFFINFTSLITPGHDYFRRFRVYEKAEPYYLGQDYLFGHNETDKKLNYIKKYLNSCSLLVSNEEDGESLIDFIKNQTEMEMKYFLSKDKISDSSNIIELKSKNNVYKFELLERESHILFSEYEYEDTTDLFETKFIPYNQTINGNASDKYYYTFLGLQSLFAKYLIFQKTNTFPQKDLKISTGLNGYPPFTNYNSQYGDTKFIGFLYSHLISLICSLFSYFYNIKLLEEREKKLTLLLERKGVNKKRYFFSWFILYLLVVVFPWFLSFISLYLILKYHYICLFINFFFFSVCMIFEFIFFYIIEISAKKSSALIEVMNFVTPFIAIILNLPSRWYIMRYIKIFFALIPQINVIFCTYSIFRLQTFKDFSFEKLWLKANKIAYMESIIKITFIILLFKYNY